MLGLRPDTGVFRTMAYRFSMFVGLVAIIALAINLNGQTDWPTYGHDPGSTHYSPLKQINTSNVANLTRAWTFHMNSTQSEVPAGAAAGGRGGRGGGGG